MKRKFCDFILGVVIVGGFAWLCVQIILG